MREQDYWEECIAAGADECDLTLTKEQLSALAESVTGGFENYGMAFYSPPPSDRASAVGDHRTGTHQARHYTGGIQCDLDTSNTQS